MLAGDSLCLAGLYPRAGLLADLSAVEYLFHGRPVRFDPTSIVTAIPVRGNSHLRKFEFGPVPNSFQIEYRKGIMVWPPRGSPPCLNNSLSRLHHQVKAGDVPVPGGEPTSCLSANLCLFAGKRRVFLRVHQHFEDLTRRGFECNGLPKRSRVHNRLLQKLNGNPAFPAAIDFMDILFIPGAWLFILPHRPKACGRASIEEHRTAGRAGKHREVRSCVSPVFSDGVEPRRPVIGGCTQDCR